MTNDQKWVRTILQVTGATAAIVAVLQLRDMVPEFLLTAASLLILAAAVVAVATDDDPEDASQV